MFNCINAHKDHGKGDLSLEYFLYYYQVARSSGNNQPHGKAITSKASPKKGKGKATRAAKGKGWPIHPLPTTSTIKGG